MKPRALLLVLALTAGLPWPAAAAGEDPDWPCIQRLVPEIAPGMIWAGPPVDSVDAGTEDAKLRKLAGELAARRVPLEQAEQLVADFAAGLDPEEKNEKLTLLFARALEIINRDRSSIIGGIKRYTRNQKKLAAKIADTNAELRRLPKDDVAGRDALKQQRDWDIRIYDDRRKSLAYLCEQPVLLEQRAFALARAIASHLE